MNRIIRLFFVMLMQLTRLSYVPAFAARRRGFTAGLWPGASRPSVKPRRLAAYRNIPIFLMAAVITACGGGSDADADGSSETAGVGLEQTLMLDSAHGGYEAAWGLRDCAACHSLSAIHQQAENIQPLVRRHGYDTCAGCHGRNGTDLPRRCLICHNPDDLPATPRQHGAHNHDFVAGVDVAANDGHCLACHDNPDMNGRFDINRDLTRFPDAGQNSSPYSGISDFCLRCHNRDHQQAAWPLGDGAADDTLIAIEDAWNHIDKHGKVDGLGTRIYAGLRNGYVYGSRVACTDCHAMHGTDNAKLIIGRSDTGASLLDQAFRNRPYEVVVTEGDYSQLCVLCHAMDSISDQGAEDTGNGLAGVHATGSDCLACHSHGEAVQAGM